MTTAPISKPAREITVAYLGDLLRAAGFIDDRQRADIEAADRQFRLQARGSKSRADEDASPFRALVAMNLTDASGSGTRIDDFLLARLIAEEAHAPFFKIDPLRLDVQMVESRI